MCLAIPGKIISIKKETAEVDFLGITKEVNIALVDFELKKGDFILVHAGFAIQKLAQSEAIESLKEWDKNIQQNISK